MARFLCTLEISIYQTKYPYNIDHVNINGKGILASVIFLSVRPVIQAGNLPIRLNLYPACLQIAKDQELVQYHGQQYEITGQW